MSDLAALAGMIEKTIKLIPYEAPPKRSDYASDEDYESDRSLYSNRPCKEYVLRSPSSYTIIEAEETLGIDLSFGTYVVDIQEGADIDQIAAPKRVRFWKHMHAWLWALGAENEGWKEDFPTLEALMRSIPRSRPPGYDGLIFEEVYQVVKLFLNPLEVWDEEEVETATESVGDEDPIDPFRPAEEVGEDAGHDQP